MPAYEVSRTLVKSPPELWAALQDDRLAAVAPDATVTLGEPERSLEWEASGVRGTALLEPSGWGTKVTLTAEVEGQVAEHGFWARVRGASPRPAAKQDLERRLEQLLDDLGGAHGKSFAPQ